MYIIKPYIGLDEIQFGMKSSEVKKVLGTPIKVIINNITNEQVEIVKRLQLKYRDNELVSIEFSPTVDVEIFGCSLFEEKGIVDKLKELDHTFIEKGHVINFTGIGLLLLNFNSSKKMNKRSAVLYGKSKVDFYSHYMKVI